METMIHPSYQLEPVNGRKSFYGKCKVMRGGQNGNANILYLQSYNTIVAEFDQSTGIMTVHGWYSATTATHINSFLVHCGFPTASKKEMDAWKPHTR